MNDVVPELASGRKLVVRQVEFAPASVAEFVEGVGHELTTRPRQTTAQHQAGRRRTVTVTRPVNRKIYSGGSVGPASASRGLLPFVVMAAAHSLGQVRLLLLHSAQVPWIGWVPGSAGERGQRVYLG